MNTLLALADQALQQAPPRGTGRYHYVRTQGWYLHASQTTDGRTLESGIQPTDREFWLAEDGSGRIAETRDGVTSRMSGSYGPGRLHAAFVSGESADTIQAQLTGQNPARSPFEWCQLMKEIWQKQVVSPALQAALLRILAEQPAIVVEGTVTDRAGRPGLAVSTLGIGHLSVSTRSVSATRHSSRQTRKRRSCWSANGWTTTSDLSRYFISRLTTAQKSG